MESEPLAIAVVTAVSGVALEFLRRGVRQLAEAKKAAAATLRQITDGQRAESARVIDALVAQARGEVQLLAEMRALREAIDEAVEARRRDDDAALAQLRDLEMKVDTVSRQMAAYDEFRKNPVFRRRDT